MPGHATRKPTLPQEPGPLAGADPADLKRSLQGILQALRGTRAELSMEGLFEKSRAAFLGLAACSFLGRVSTRRLDLIDDLSDFLELPRSVCPALALEMERLPAFCEEIRQPVDLCQALAGLASRLLEFDLQCLDGELEVLALDKMLKQTGSYFTPPVLARQVVAAAMAALPPAGAEAEVFGRPLRILDPAMGPGIFLLSAWQELEARGYRHDPVETLYGVDLDPANVLCARFILWYAAGATGRDAFSRFANLRAGDSLAGSPVSSLPPEFAGQWQRLEAILALDSSRAVSRRAALWFVEPGEFSLDVDDDELVFRLDRISARERIFAYEEQFVPVFDMILGNPPWEIAKPNSREFFGRYERSYWAYEKQKAIFEQSSLSREHPGLWSKWSRLQSRYRSLRRFVRAAFRKQGRGDLNLYKLFVERSLGLLRPDGGVLSMIVPAGIYCDSGSRELRRYLIERCNLTDIVGFENTDNAFPIHRSFKYCYFVACKGSATGGIKTSFLNSASAPSPEPGVSLNSGRIAAMSPDYFIFPEVEGENALAILERIYDSGRLLDGYKIFDCSLAYRRELDMTMDSGLFSVRDELEGRGYRADIFGNWLSGKWQSGKLSDTIASADGKSSIAFADIEDVYVPVYEGRMIGSYNSSAKHWLSGHGRKAVWRDSRPGDNDIAGPRYLVPAAVLDRAVPGLKTGFLAVGSDTNARSMIAACLNQVVCGNSVPVFYLKGGGGGALPQTALQMVLTGVLNSFVFDFVVRRRLAGCNLNYFVLAECPLPALEKAPIELLRLVARMVASLSMPSSRLAASSLEPSTLLPDPVRRRLLMAFVDAAVAGFYGLAPGDLQTILSGCLGRPERGRKSFTLGGSDLDGAPLVVTGRELERLPGLPPAEIARVMAGIVEGSVDTSRSLPVNPKGFHRVDRLVEPAFSHPAQTIVTAQLAESLGPDAFLEYGRGLLPCSEGDSRAVGKAALLERILKLRTNS